MPFIAHRSGDSREVIPEEAGSEDDLQCPECEGELRIRQSHRRGRTFVARHFYHFTGADECGMGGESLTHQKMKSIAISKLHEEFGDENDEEVEILTEQPIGDRRTDVRVQLETPRKPYGRGIGVEVQFRNEGKDVEAVTEEYFEAGYSALWLGEDNFDRYDVDISRIRSVWPYALPDRSGLDGYSERIRELRMQPVPNVEIDVPIPGAFWARFDKEGKWVTAASRSGTQGRLASNT